MELPVIFPSLVEPIAPTRLAIPLEPMLALNFDFDILGCSGMPLLSASMVTSDGRQSIGISLHGASELLVVVTPSMQIMTPEGSSSGTIHRAGTGHALCDAAGRKVAEFMPGPTPYEVSMVKPPGLHDPEVELATTCRRGAGKLPAEHFEVVVGPNVDPVLVVACFLALVVFGLPPPSMS